MTRKIEKYYTLRNLRNMTLLLEDQINEISNVSAHLDDIYSEEINNAFHAIKDLEEKVLRGGESK